MQIRAGLRGSRVKPDSKWIGEIPKNTSDQRTTGPTLISSVKRGEASGLFSWISDRGDSYSEFVRRLGIQSRVLISERAKTKSFEDAYELLEGTRLA